MIDVEVGVPMLSHRDWDGINTTIDAVAAAFDDVEDTGAGTGFGYRDRSYRVASVERAGEFARAVQAAFPGRNVRISMDEASDE